MIDESQEDPRYAPRTIAAVIKISGHRRGDFGGAQPVGSTHGTSPEQLAVGWSLPTPIWLISRITYFEENE